ncbi:hypothetical protein ScalyP_jg78, partial [Parmales sp. scaly parma]
GGGEKGGRIDHGAFIRICVDGGEAVRARGGKGDNSNNNNNNNNNNNGINSGDAILLKIQESLNTSSQPYGSLFLSGDPHGTGLVARSGLISALRTAGAYLTSGEVRLLSKRRILKKRADGKVDYNELYHAILQLTPRNSGTNMSMSMSMAGMGAGGGGGNTPYNAAQA